jgi:YihY family inner membrane protein
MSKDDPTTEIEKEVPIAAVSPVVRADGFWPQLMALARYMIKTEVHTYAFSVAANVVLSLFPFIVLLLTISIQVFHSAAMKQAVFEMITAFFPSNQDFIIHNMKILVAPHKSVQIFSVVMLLISSTGVFLPLEVALNSVWGVRENRSYLRNQLVSIGLAFAVGTLAMASIALTAGQESLLSLIFFGHTNNIAYHFLSGSMLRILAAIAGILIFFLIYWILPNRKVPMVAVLPTAIVIGLLWEAAKYLYVLVLPRLNLQSIYGPFQVSVGLMIWAFLSGLLVLAGAHFSATRYALAVARKEAREAEAEKEGDPQEQFAQTTQKGGIHAERA